MPSGPGRPARFAEQRLRLGRIERVLAFVRRVVVRLEGGHDRAVGGHAIALFDGRDDGLAIDRVLEGLAHLDILEARIGLVQRQPVILDQLARLDAYLRCALDAIDGRLVVHDHDAQLAAERLRDLGVGVGDDFEHELVQVGFAAEIGVVARQDHALAGGVGLDFERSAGDRRALVERGHSPTGRPGRRRCAWAGCPAL